MRIVVIGGHGKVALLLAPKLLADGHEVDAVIRNPDHADDVAATGARPVVADVEAMDLPLLAALFRGHEAVVWSAGAGGGNPTRTYAVDRDAAIRSMDAAAAAGVRRYVIVSYLGAGTPDRPHGVDRENGFYPYAEAKSAADTSLRETALAWTILKPSRLTLVPSAGCLDPEPADAGGDTSRELVADVVRAVLAAPAEAVAGWELAFTDGAVPIAEALTSRTAGQDR